MNDRRPRPRTLLTHRPYVLTLIVVFMLAGAAIVPLYSTSASFSPIDFRGIGNDHRGTLNAGRLGSSLSLNPLGTGAWSSTSFLSIPLSPPEQISIFAADCTTPKTTFVLGETVCAQTAFVTETDRWVNWIDPSLNVARGGPTTTPITTNATQNFLYIPTSVGTWKAAIADASDSAIISAPFTVESPIATYAYPGCATPKTDFNLGETVCVKAKGVPNTLFPWRISWVDPGGLIRQTDIASTNDSTTYTYTLPTDPTTEVNGQTIDNRGTWRANLARSNGSIRATARFVVHQPANPQADVLVQKFQRDGGDTIHVGENAAFVVVVQNAGPDPAADVHLLDSVPAGGTLVSFTQNTGPTCTQSGPGDCTIAAMTNGDRAEFTAIYTIGGSPGSQQTSASVSSTTPDPKSDNNSATADFAVASGAAGGGGCELTCPSDITAFANTTEGGQRGAHVNFDSAVGTGTCGAVTSTPASGAFFQVGTTIVMASSETGDGACQFAVTVEEQSGNVSISCPANLTGNADVNCAASFNLGNPTTAGDNVTVTASRSDGKPMYDCDTSGQNCVRKTTDLPFAAGVTTITWTAYSHSTPGPYATPADEEAARTGSQSCTQTVTVNDVTPPVIAATNQTVSADANCQAVVPDYSSTITDNCACDSSDSSEACMGHPNVAITQDPAPGTVVGLGPHVVHLTANDGSSNNGGAGNTSTKDITLTVVDTTPPTVSCPAPTSASADANCQAPVPDVTSGASASDNCSGTITKTQSPAAGTMVGLGPHTITVTATDASGNHSTCTTTFTVNDTTPPTVSCPAPTTASADANCQAPIPNVVPNVTKSDNCGSVNVTQSPAAGTMVGLGPHTITVTATDGSGNSSSCTTTFTVNDTTGPVITLNGQTQSMWPPNHKYQTFQVTNFVTSVHDNCTGTIPVSSVVITKVTSDELENSGGDGNTLNDIIISSDCKSVQLRSERDGGGNGRVYTIFFKVFDSYGNAGTATATVVVPHNPGETVVDSGPHYTVMSSCP